MSFVTVTGPPDGDDWTGRFQTAISHAVSHGHAGVLVPASASPYTFRRPAPGSGLHMSIDLRGMHDFVLTGEGPRSVLAMLGPGEWRLIHIGAATDVVVRDLWLDGSSAPDADHDQSHLIKIGDSSSTHHAGGARRIAVVDCTLNRAPADGVAISPASSTLSEDEVSDIVISGCRFLGCGRSGISNQRLAKRVSILHNTFEATSDQDIDFEPSGDLPDSGPSGYLILGNTMVRRGLNRSVTLSGTSPESPSRINTFAYNQIRGGQLGVIDAQDLAIVGNYLEVGPKQAGAAVRLTGAIERVLFADNSVVRPPNAAAGPLLNLSSQQLDYAFPAGQPGIVTAIDAASDTLTRTGHGLQTGTGPLRASVDAGGTLPGGLAAGVDYWAIRVDEHRFRLADSPAHAGTDQAVNLTSPGTGTRHLIRHGFPRTVTISRNRFTTYRRLPTGEPLITVANASTVTFADNDVASYAGVTLDVGLKFEVGHGVRKRPVSGWEVVGNRFRGNARLDPDFDTPPTGSFETAVSMSAGRDTVSDVRVAANTFSGCQTQVRLHAEAAGRFRRAPYVTGNVGDGIAVALSGVEAYLVGGNLQTAPGAGAGTPPAGARYCGQGDPDTVLVAPIGSLYSRLDGTAGHLLYVNSDGGSAWVAIA